MQYLYCYQNGIAKFGKKVPKGAIVVDKRTERQLKSEAKTIREMRKAWSKDSRKPYPPSKWKDGLTAKMRLGYDGRTMLIPGIPEAANQAEAYHALCKFIQWAVR